MPFVFGGVDDQPLEQQSRQNGSADPSVSDTSGRTGGLDAAGSQALLEARSKMELLIRLLVAANARTSALFVDIWSEAWSDKRTTVSWNHVHALISVAIKDSIEEQSEFGQMLQSLATRICRAYYYRLSRYVGQDNTHDDVAVKFSEALNLLLSSTHPAANVLLQEVLSALADFEQEHPADACTIFGNAVTQQLGKCGGGGMETSVKRGVVQKPLVEYDRSPLDAAVDVTSFKSSVTSIHLLTILTSLAGTKNSTGDFTRRVLSTGPLVRLLTGLINIGRRRRRQEMLLDVMNVVVISNTSAKLNREWARHEKRDCSAAEYFSAQHERSTGVVVGGITTVHEALLWTRRDVQQRRVVPYIRQLSGEGRLFRGAGEGDGDHTLLVLRGEDANKPFSAATTPEAGRLRIPVQRTPSGRAACSLSAGALRLRSPPLGSAAVGEGIVLAIGSY
ncbi:hypothetical protein ON010_g3930 [Phytophthora cinnamomi]|nr:hypothetical protein ON010_g3930 [Phytophthora cinnamomi]